ncbi:hypothetical protein H0H92_003952 [Tricholoma furcatifolium]|nr:hypothetical protein H0H92_003952 [Tricholoma furcatifolium]
MSYGMSVEAQAVVSSTIRKPTETWTTRSIPLLAHDSYEGAVDGEGWIFAVDFLGSVVKYAFIRTTPVPKKQEEMGEQEENRQDQREQGSVENSVTDLLDLDGFLKEMTKEGRSPAPAAAVDALRDFFKNNDVANRSKYDLDDENEYSTMYPCQMMTAAEANKFILYLRYEAPIRRNSNSIVWVLNVEQKEGRKAATSNCFESTALPCAPSIWSKLEGMALGRRDKAAVVSSNEGWPKGFQYKAVNLSFEETHAQLEDKGQQASCKSENGKARSLNFDERSLAPTPTIPKIMSEAIDDTFVVAASSATGEGLNTRWIYREGALSISDVSSVAGSSSSTLLNPGEDQSVHNKLTIKIPSLKTEPPAKLFAHKPRVIQPTHPIDGVEPCGTPTVVTTSATTLGLDVRWNYIQTITQPQEKLLIRIPPRHYFANDTVQTEQLKHTLNIPASKKRARTEDDNDSLFLRCQRPRLFARDVIIAPTKGADKFICCGVDNDSQPIVISTSSTGQGTHTRWLYNGNPSSLAQSVSTTDDMADDEVSSSDSTSDCDVMAAPATVGSPVKGLRRLSRPSDSNSSEDRDEGFTRRTHSRLFAPLPRCRSQLNVV